MRLLEQEARKESIESKGKNYRFWLFRRKLYHTLTIYTLIIALVAAIVFLWKNYILKYDWLSINTVTYTGNGVFTHEQIFKLLDTGRGDEVFDRDSDELRRSLMQCSAIRRAVVRRRVLTDKPTLEIEVDGRHPFAWLSCPELGLQAEDPDNGILTDKSGIIFPYIHEVHAPLLKDKKLPVIIVRQPAYGVFSYGAKLPSLEVPIKLADLLSGAVAEYMPTIESVSRPNEWSLRVCFTNDCQATFSPYDLERQIEKLTLVLERARLSHRKIRTVNLIPETNIPATFDESYEEIPDAEPLSE